MLQKHQKATQDKPVAERIAAEDQGQATASCDVFRADKASSGERRQPLGPASVSAVDVNIQRHNAGASREKAYDGQPSQEHHAAEVKTALTMATLLPTGRENAVGGGGPSPSPWQPSSVTGPSFMGRVSLESTCTSRIRLSFVLYDPCGCYY